MKRITKIISAILAVLIVTAVFAGCSSSNDNSTANGFRTLDEIKSSGKSISAYFPTKTHSVMLTKTASIRATMFTLQTDLARTSE